MRLELTVLSPPRKKQPLPFFLLSFRVSSTQRVPSTVIALVVLGLTKDVLFYNMLFEFGFDQLISLL